MLVRVLRNRINISQWFPVCSRLVPVSSTQGKWGRALSGTFQWSPMSQFLGCGRSEQIPGVGVQWSRKYHTTNKLSTTKDSPQPVEEKVGAFTKIIEAMGFTGPLKYSKWKIKIAALRMYTSCVEKTDFEEFFLTPSEFGYTPGPPSASPEPPAPPASGSHLWKPAETSTLLPGKIMA